MGNLLADGSDLGPAYPANLRKGEGPQAVFDTPLPKEREGSNRL